MANCGKHTQADGSRPPTRCGGRHSGRLVRRSPTVAFAPLLASEEASRGAEIDEAALRSAPVLVLEILALTGRGHRAPSEGQRRRVPGQKSMFTESPRGLARADAVVDRDSLEAPQSGDFLLRRDLLTAEALQQPAQERGALGGRRLSHEPILADSPTQKCVNDHSRESDEDGRSRQTARITCPRAQYSASVAFAGRRTQALEPFGIGRPAGATAPRGRSCGVNRGNRRRGRPEST